MLNPNLRPTSLVYVTKHDGNDSGLISIIGTLARLVG
jgi:hypothetical protein